MAERVEVLVVGAGPTGLAVANLLGSHGIETLVVEREVTVATEPRAVSVDDEAMRLLQSLGLPSAPGDTVVPGNGTRYYGTRGQLLGGAASPVVPPLGHPLKNPIDHGAFTRLLLDGLDSRPSVAVRFRSELVDLDLDEEGVAATVRGPAGDFEVAARYLLGCDGGRSIVRSRLGVEMSGASVDEPWLVIDTVGDPHAQRFAMHHGDPVRPHVVLPGPLGRCRYEFLLLPGEGEAEARKFETARRLIGRYRPGLEPDDIVRQQVYVFHSLLADRWRVGDAFLLGDAAHMMPPFAGQGLSTGLRDAANLGWKLAWTLRGRLGEAVLHSYEAERRPHARAMIDLSVRRGRLVMTRSRSRAGARDAAVWLARRSGRIRRRLDHLPLKPIPRHADGLYLREGRVSAVVGAMLPQPRVLAADGRTLLLDEALGPGFALVEVDREGPAASLEAPLWDRIGARRLRLVRGERFAPDGEPAAFADLDGLLDEPLADCRSLVLLVRPDRFVMAAFSPAEETTIAAACERRERVLTQAGVAGM